MWGKILLKSFNHHSPWTRSVSKQRLGWGLDLMASIPSFHIEVCSDLRNLWAKTTLWKGCRPLPYLDSREQLCKFDTSSGTPFLNDSITSIWPRPHFHITKYIHVQPASLMCPVTKECFQLLSTRCLNVWELQLVLKLGRLNYHQSSQFCCHVCAFPWACR